MRHHFLSICNAACIFHLYYSLVQAQTVQSIIWNVPDGSLSDLSQTFADGNTIPLSWNAWTSPNYIDASQSLLDLWVTAFDYNLNQFSQLLRVNLNLTLPGNYAWTIAIPDSNLAISAKYVLRFKIHASTYDPNTADLSSPGFLVLQGGVSSASTSSSSTTLSSSSSTASSSSVTTTSSSSPSLSPTATADTGCSSCGLSMGAKAGIGVGVVAAVLALVGLALFVFLRKRKMGETATEPNTDQPENDMVQGQDKHGSPSDPIELPTRGAWNPVELPGISR